MADNVAVTAGSGTNIAADDVGGIHHQRVKISLGADGSATDAVSGAGAVGDGVQRVTLASDDPLVAYFEGLDTAAPVPIESHGFDVTVAPTVTNGAYAAGDIMGALLTFTISAANDKPVIVTGAEVACKAAVTLNLTLHLFNADPTNTTKTDNAAYSLAAADVFKHIKSINFTQYGGIMQDHGTPNTIDVDGLNIVVAPATGTQNIFGLLVDGTGVTLTSTSDIQVRLRGIGT